MDWACESGYPNHDQLMGDRIYPTSRISIAGSRFLDFYKRKKGQDRILASVRMGLSK
jgi:hypothetical protein